jgi:catechol 2,3-dioxygenase-like lactoylglutathione lyase family enzyme
MAANDKSIGGLHHVTAITADAQKNIDFYCDVLGLRLVKLTVNFDDPGSYHLYYGDDLGRPGSVMTFFAWPGAQRGRVGPAQVAATAFAVPSGALDYWSARLKKRDAQPQAIIERFGQRVLGFVDTDAMPLELVEVTNPKGEAWAKGPVPVEHAIRGFYGVTIWEEGYEDTARLLTDVMGFKAAGNEQNHFRYQAGSGDGFACTVDLLCVPDARHGSMGAGVVHHVAFRTKDDAQQAAWHKQIAGLGFNISPVMDRTYFHSIYYREPGGVLFEIATESPGFTVDESREQLGSQLMLPPQFQAYRAQIQRVLPAIRLPVVAHKTG